MTVKDPVEHAALYQELINVTTEIKSLEPVLLSPDAPVITANSAAGTVFTKTKIGSDGTRYLFSYNYTASPVTAEFTLAQPAASILDYDTGVTCAPDTSTTFSARIPAVPGARLSHQRFRLRADARSRARRRRQLPTATRNTDSDANADCDSHRNGNSYRNADCVPRRQLDRNCDSTDHDADCDLPQRRPPRDAYRDGHARRIVSLAYQFEIRRSESRHHEPQPRLLKVTNTSAATVKFTGMSVTGDFAQTNTCGASLAAHMAAVNQRYLQPTAIGKRPATCRSTTTPPIVRRWST